MANFPSPPLHFALLSASPSLMHFDSACTVIWWPSVSLFLCHSLPVWLVNIAESGLDMPVAITETDSEAGGGRGGEGAGSPLAVETTVSY